MTLTHRVGIGNAFKFGAAAPNAVFPPQTIARFSDPSFRYHIPHRIASRCASTWTAPQVHALSPSPNVSGGTASPAANLTTNVRSLSYRAFASPLAGVFPTTIRQEIDRKPHPSVSQCVYQVTFRRQFSDSVERRDAKTRQEKEAKDKILAKEHKSSDENSGGEHFYDRIHMPHFHRPTKEELLAAATGFWSRLKVRFKWATIRSARPFNVDEIVGFFSWIALGHVVWLVIGTTTFISLAIFAINTVFAQETLAGWVGEYLTKSSGLKVVFESAIVPKWGDGVITFKNVFVSRRPGQDKSSVRKGSAIEAAAAAASQEIPEEDQNYTQFDISLGEVNVTLSFSKWWNSKGLLQNVEIKRVRGVIDRTHVHWIDDGADPKSYRHEHNPGDFEIESFKIEDLLLTLHQPKRFRPFTVSIYQADLPRLRKQWIMYDFLCANNMTGEFDHSMFAIHQRQSHSALGTDLQEADKHEPWKRQSRLRIDGLNIDHLNRGVEGPFSWIHEGNVDIIADIMIPNDNDDSVIKVMSDFYDQVEAQFLLKKKHLQRLLDTNVILTQDDEGEDMVVQLPAPSATDASPDSDRRYLVMDLRVHLNDVRAVVPLFTKELSYVNSALIRPIVAYINSRRTFIPINCRVVKRVSDFDGSWTIYDSGLMDDLSAETYDAFSRDVTDEQARMRRFKKVGLWSLQLAVQAIFLVSSSINCICLHTNI